MGISATAVYSCKIPTICPSVKRDIRILSSLRGFERCENKLSFWMARDLGEWVKDIDLIFRSRHTTKGIFRTYKQHINQHQMNEKHSALTVRLSEHVPTSRSHDRDKKSAQAGQAKPVHEGSPIVTFDVSVAQGFKTRTLQARSAIVTFIVFSGAYFQIRCTKDCP